MSIQGDDSSEDRDRVGEATARLAQDTAQLARHELLVMQSEVRAALRRIRAGGVLLGAAGVCGVLALWSMHETLLRSMESVLPGARASAVLGGMYATGAVTLALAARDRVCTVPGASVDDFDRADDAAGTGPGDTDMGDRPG
jgi:hypothetical protein